MKKNVIITSSISLALLISVLGLASRTYRNPIKSSAYNYSTLPTNIDLNDTSAADVRSYYNTLNDLSASERQGTNLLKNLKTILKNGQQYFTYDNNNGRQIWQLYEISDRDWAKSPASEISGYNSQTNTITGYSYGTSASYSGTNPYIRALYVNREATNMMHAWALEGTKTTSHGTSAEWHIDREHIWPKSQGFAEDDSITEKGGARGDPMHLWPGDSDVNSTPHNNNHYGYVDKDNIANVGKWSYATNNFSGTSLTLGSGVVFEPQDSDKGDIARAIFYMAARYNFLSGSDSDGINCNNPNLELVQDNTVLSTYISSETNTGKQGILTDLLNWHHQDPVDEFEIHRNNLLYTNFTKNRNPFIDFPEWADYIWGTASYDDRYFQSYDPTPTGYAKPNSDTLNAFNPHEQIPVTGVTISQDSATILKGGTLSLSATVSPSDASNKGVEWTSSDAAIASVANTGVVTAHNYGNATITVTTKDGGFTDTCLVTVAPNSISVSVDKTYLVGETISKDDITVLSDDNLELYNFAFSNDGYQFTYSDASGGGALTNKTFTNSISCLGLTASLTVQVQRKEYEQVSDPVRDTLDRVFTGSTGTTYKDWTKSAPSSPGVYAGNSAGGNSSIQLRSTTSSGSDVHAGIISTTSGGTLSGVSVVWYNAGTGNTINIYGSTSPYTSPNDLFDESTCGTLLGTIVRGESTSLEVTGNYTYVGVRSALNALYLTSITFHYGKEQTAYNVSNYIMYEDTQGQCNTKTDIAIGYYNKMSLSEKEIFNTSNDYVISNARDRFNAWLANQGKHIDESTYAISKVKSVENFEENDSVTPMIIVVSLVSSISMVALLILKKRKNR